MPDYFTDGHHLFEVVSRRTFQNFGLTRGVIRYTIVRDVVSEAMATLDDLTVAALEVVR